MTEWKRKRERRKGRARARRTWGAWLTGCKLRGPGFPVWHWAWWVCLFSYSIRRSLFLPEEVPFEELLCWGVVSPWTGYSCLQTYRKSTGKATKMFFKAIFQRHVRGGWNSSKRCISWLRYFFPLSSEFSAEQRCHMNATGVRCSWGPSGSVWSGGGWG